MNTIPKIHRAGLIPYIIEDNVPVMMFMVPSNPIYGGSLVEHHHPDGSITSEMVSLPQIAKGRVEDGEDNKTAALREAKEELGLFIGNVVLVEELGLFMGRTTVFVAKVKDRNMFGLAGEETESVIWMTEQQFLESGRVLHHPVVQATVRKINQIEKLV